MKNKLIDAYLPKKSSFKDKSLLNKITKDPKKKTSTGNEPLTKTVSERRIQPIRENFMEKREVKNRESEEKRGKST